jgi:hypothetical protein
MDWENQLVFLLLISSSLILSASAEEPCMRTNRYLNLLVQRRDVVYYPFILRQRYGIIVLIHGMPKASSTGLSTHHKLRDVLSNPDRR